MRRTLGRLLLNDANHGLAVVAKSECQQPMKNRAEMKESSSRPNRESPAESSGKRVKLELAGIGTAVACSCNGVEV